jgi:hypothetical protein
MNHGDRSRCGAPVVERLDHRVPAQMGTQPHGVIHRSVDLVVARWELPEL